MNFIFEEFGEIVIDIMPGLVFIRAMAEVLSIFTAY